MLRGRVMTEFWLPSLHTFAPALVLDCTGPKPTRIVASSPGHLLDTRLLDGEDAGPRREALICRLLAPDMLAAAGVRTKSTTAPRVRPGSFPQRVRPALGDPGHCRGAEGPSGRDGSGRTGSR